MQENSLFKESSEPPPYVKLLPHRVRHFFNPKWGTPSLVKILTRRTLVTKSEQPYSKPNPFLNKAPQLSPSPHHVVSQMQPHHHQTPHPINPPDKIRQSQAKRSAKIERLEKSELWLAKLINWAEHKGTPTGLQASIFLKRELMKNRKLRLHLKNKQTK